MAERPPVIKPGDVWLEPIDEILKRESLDGGYEGDGWDWLLDDKRNDNYYPDVVRSLKEHGFKRPLTCSIDDYDPSDYQFGDGHHRLAAAIDLGLTHVPLEAYPSGSWGVSDDSGSWYYDQDIPESNKARR